MSERYKGCTVTFNRDIRDDEAQCILNAIRMLKNVEVVSPCETAPDDWINRSRVLSQLRKKVEVAFSEMEGL